MAQTSYIGFLVNPSGHRIVIQAGTHKFTAQTSKCTMTIKFRRLYAAHVRPSQKAAGGGKTASMGAYLPYVSTTQFTQALGKPRVTVDRKSGATMSGLSFSYILIGC